MTVGSNFQLIDKKLSGEAKKPLQLRVEEALCLSGSGQTDDVRTRFELRDPEFLQLITNIKKLKAMVEAVEHTGSPLLQADGAREPSTTAVTDSAWLSRPRKRSPPRRDSSFGLGSA